MHTQTSDFHLDTDNRNAKTHIEDWKISMLCKEHDLRPKHSHTFTPTFQSSIFWLFPNRVHGFSLSTGTRLCSSYRAGPRAGERSCSYGGVSLWKTRNHWNHFVLRLWNGNGLVWSAKWFVVCGFAWGAQKSDSNLTPKGDKHVWLFVSATFLWICVGVHHPFYFVVPGNLGII